MKTEFLRKFSKDLDVIKDRRSKQLIILTINSVKSAESLESLPNIKKLKGFSDAYRIRAGNYRIGIFLSEDVVQFARVVHRKDIYRVFP